MNDRDLRFLWALVDLIARRQKEKHTADEILEDLCDMLNAYLGNK